MLESNHFQANHTVVSINGRTGKAPFGCLQNTIFYTITDIAGHASHRCCNMWHNTLNYPRSTLAITYLMSSLDKAIIVDNEKF